jgi:hypothetical protein
MVIIPEEMESLIEFMNKDKEHEGLESSAITSHRPDDWLSALDNDLLNTNGKTMLAEKYTTDKSFLPVLKHIAMENGLGVSLSREIYGHERWEELQDLISSYNIRGSQDRHQQIHSFGAMLGDRRTFFWFLKILFSKTVMKGIKDSLWNKDSSARLAAIRSLEKYNIEDTEAVFVRALDDSNKEIREVALKALKEKIPAERLNDILEEEEEEAKSLLQSVEEAKLSTLEMMSGIGEWAASLGKNAFEKASSGVNFLANEAASVTSPVKSIWSKFTRKDKNDAQESPDALFALCICLAWVDGKIEINEKEMLASILKENGLDKKFAYWLIEKPDIDELEPYLKRLKNPEKAIFELAEKLNLQVEQQNEWLRSIENAIGIGENTIFLRKG